ncbi:MAG: hypothetical protein J4F34_01390 [Gemmatimonadetes bacterium]|nr:hypothetical protein [Gemmatimonadota bacterium]
MRPSRTPAPAFALAAVLCVAMCTDPTPTGTAAPADTGRAADGGEPMAARSSGGGTDTIFDPFTPRLALAISTDGELLPNAPVTLTISGEAREVIDGGEVVVRLPTKAAMDHAGEGQPLYYPIGRTVPAKATWRLPAMGVGDTWERTVTVPAAAAGYYMVAVDADTEGPASDLGPYLFDDSYAQAWMFVSDTDGQLTDVFEDSLFAEGVLPVPGPFTTETELLSRPLAASVSDSGSARILVVYYDGREPIEFAGFQPAVGARVWGQYTTADGKKTYGQETYRTVPEDGIVEFPCPPADYPLLRGRVDLPKTTYVEGKDEFVPWYSFFRSLCGGGLLGVTGERHDYLPWRNLNDVIPRINKHFGYSRSRVKWEVDFDLDDGDPGASYHRGDDKIVFSSRAYHDDAAAHEYTHALHHKAMGGLWETNCGGGWSYSEPSSYECAFSEGLAVYGGRVGVGAGTLEIPSVEGRPKPKVVAFVVALFKDLIDAPTSGSNGSGDVEEPEDKTHYHPHYVMKVFATCEVKYPHWTPGDWEARDDVSDFVRCLENRVDASEHERIFHGIETPDSAREEATEPSDWSADSIRSTWLWNMQ